MNQVWSAKKFISVGEVTWKCNQSHHITSHYHLIITSLVFFYSSWPHWGVVHPTLIIYLLRLDVKVFQEVGFEREKQSSLMSNIPKAVSLLWLNHCNVITEQNKQKELLNSKLQSQRWFTSHIELKSAAVISSFPARKNFPEKSQIPWVPPLYSNLLWFLSFVSAFKSCSQTTFFQGGIVWLILNAYWETEWVYAVYMAYKYKLQSGPSFSSSTRREGHGRLNRTGGI